MHILILVSGYPTAYSANQGIFFRDQAESLARDPKNKVAVIAAVPVSAKAVLKKRLWSFILNSEVKNDVRTLVRTFPNIPKIQSYRVVKARRLGIKMIAGYIREYGKPDVIHIHGFQAGLQGVEAKRKFGIPFVVTEHSSQFIDDIVPESLEKYAKTVFKEADAAIAVSEPFAEIMSERYKRPFHYIPNVVDTKLFHPDPESSEKKEFTFFNAAAFVIEKNHTMLLEAFALLLKTHPKTRLKLAGSGAGEQAAKDLVKELHIEKQVDFLGFLPRNEIIKEMQQMDAFVLSSNVETFGVVLIEALSCGKPVISTDCFGPRSIITSPEYGILSPQTAKDLAEAMKQMIANYSSFDSEAIRKYVVGKFSGEVVTGQLTELYKEIVSKSNA